MVVIHSVLALCAVTLTGIFGYILFDWNRRENRKMLIRQAEHSQSSWDEFEAKYKDDFERSYVTSIVDG